MSDARVRFLSVRNSSKSDKIYLNYCTSKDILSSAKKTSTHQPNTVLKQHWYDANSWGVLVPEHVEGRVEEKIEHGAGVQIGVPHHLTREEGLT